MTVTLPPRPYHTLLYTGAAPQVDPEIIKVFNKIQDRAQLLQLAEAFVTREKGHRILWRALPPKTKTNFAKLMPISPPFLEEAYFYHIYPENLKLPKLLRFDNVAFRVTSVIEREFKAFEFFLDSDSTKSLIKVGHGHNPALTSLTPEEEKALSNHFDLHALNNELDEKFKNIDAETKVQLAHKKLHHFDLMRQWWAKAAWNKLGAPVAMPYWISSMGGWELIHHYPKVSSFASDAVAHCLNLSLHLEQEVGVPLLNGSWDEIKGKMIVVGDKVLIEGRVPPFAMAPYDRTSLIEEIKEREPLLFMKLKIPTCLEQKMLLKEHKKEGGGVIKLRTLALIHALRQGKNVRHYAIEPISTSSPLLKDQLFLLNILREVKALSSENAILLFYQFVSKALADYVEECRQEWIQKRTTFSVLTLISEWSSAYITRS